MSIFDKSMNDDAGSAVDAEKFRVMDWKRLKRP